MSSDPHVMVLEVCPLLPCSRDHPGLHLQSIEDEGEQAQLQWLCPCQLSQEA